MTAFVTRSRTAPWFAPHGGARKDLFVALFEPLLAWEQRIRQRQQLADMDDHMLQDIGVGRAEAAMEAAKPFWRA